MSFPHPLKTLRLLPVLLVLLLASLRATAQTASTPSFANLPGHPRILLLAGEEAAIREMVAPAGGWQKLHQAILTECDSLDGLPPIERVQVGRRLLDKSRECLRRVFYLSYAYRVTGQASYLKRAEREMLAVAAFSDWNPSHFLDVAEMTMGMAIGYDWLHAGLSDSAKVRIREAILKKGIEPS
ncbi:MAG TPA: heparinase, partial [Cytophagales bacterium]